MEASIFEKLYQYREKPGKGDFENFCTEVLRYAIGTDEVFKQEILSGLKLEGTSLISLESQVRTPSHGIPDLLLITDKKEVVLFEIKVDSVQGEHQLSTYTEWLKHKYKSYNKHLVFLTKYYEKVEFKDNAVSFQTMRWYEIYHLIDTDMGLWVQELRNFLKVNGMSQDNKLTVQDLATLSKVYELITKMDEVLYEVAEEVNAIWPGVSKTSSRSTRLQYYGAYENFKNLTNTTLMFGFWQNDDKGLPECYVWLTLRNETKETLTEFKKLQQVLTEDKGWVYEHEEKEYHLHKTKLLHEFLAPDKSLKDVVEFMKGALDEVVVLKEDFKDLL